MRTGRKILPLAMGGAYGWIGKTGIKETASGERVSETGAIPDLNICRDGRVTYVLLDSNCGLNQQVLGARDQLARQLRKQAAEVQILDLPANPGVNGPDDYIGVMGDEAMGRLFDCAMEGAKILDDIRSFLWRFVILSPAQAAAIALWVCHTYVFRSAAWTPYLYVGSAAPECGKSLLLEVLEFLVRKPWKVDGASPAVLFRKIEVDKPTLLFDELDTTFKGDKEMAQAIRQVLNAGAKYNGVIARIVGEKHTPKDFSVFCPKVLAGIGSLPATVSSRALPITLTRKMTVEQVEYLDHDDLNIKAAAADLRSRLSDWTEKREASFRQAPDFPDALSDRQKDGARILLVIADTAGGDWPTQARTVLTELYGARPADDVSIGIQLLGDVRVIFDEDELDKVFTTDLLEKLAKVETSPWAEWNRGKPMSAIGLSRLLRPFQIYPKSLRIATGNAKGYERTQFEDAWGRYNAKTAPRTAYPPESAVTPLQPAPLLTEPHLSEPSQEASVTGSRNEESSISMTVVTGVTGEKGGDGKTRVYEELELICPVHGSHRQWWVKISPNGGEMRCGQCEPPTD